MEIKDVNVNQRLYCKQPVRTGNLMHRVKVVSVQATSDSATVVFESTGHKKTVPAKNLVPMSDIQRGQVFRQPTNGGK